MAFSERPRERSRPHAGGATTQIRRTFELSARGARGHGYSGLEVHLTMLNSPIAVLEADLKRTFLAGYESCHRISYRAVGGGLIQGDRARDIGGESAGGVSPPAALRTVRETLASHGSHQVNKPLCQRLACCAPELLPFPVGPRTRPPDPPPSLQPHYRAFVATTGRSAPVLGIDTLASRL